MRVLRLYISCPCSERHSPNGDASYPQQASTSGNSGAMVSSTIAFVKDLEPWVSAAYRVARLNGEEILSAAMIVGDQTLSAWVHDRR
jgi:hypothetical protein